jgi:hypothetical protein
MLNTFTRVRCEQSGLSNGRDDHHHRPIDDETPRLAALEKKARHFRCTNQVTFINQVYLVVRADVFEIDSYHLPLARVRARAPTLTRDSPG